MVSAASTLILYFNSLRQLGGSRKLCEWKTLPHNVSEYHKLHSCLPSWLNFVITMVIKQKYMWILFFKMNTLYMNSLHFIECHMTGIVLGCNLLYIRYKFIFIYNRLYLLSVCVHIHIWKKWRKKSSEQC